MTTTKATTKVHEVTAAVPVGPSGPGAVGGHEAHCVTCGMRFRTSLSARVADADAAAHVAFWASR